MLHIRLSDDGAGLSAARIQERAVEIGRIAPGETLEHKELVKMIFQSGFSTADTVTAVSGRGYGLAAVRDSIYSIGGKIKVSSSKGRGTGFTIIVPNERMVSIMKAEYANVFIRSAVHVFKKELNINLTRQSLVKKNAPIPGLPICIVLGITGSIRGQVVYSIDRSFAQDITHAMLPEQTAP